jgi:hypothetical protein
VSEDAYIGRGWRAHELVGGLPVAAWAAFHLYEQWAAFAGREAWLARMARTSHGALAVAIELGVAVLPALAWVGLDLALRARSPEPAALRSAMAEDPELARRLGLLARACSWVFFGWLAYHAGWLWAPKLAAGGEPLLAWVALRDGMGRWPHAILHAVGLTAFAVHLWAAAPRIAIALSWVDSPEGRRAARLSGFVVALGVVLLYAQLAGWHAAARGTLWSI